MEPILSTPVNKLIFRDKQLSLEKPKLVGILNITPDSFSDGGLFFEQQKAIQHALNMIEEGADWIDIGGESSGPGSQSISVEEELRRIIPVIEGIRQKSDIWISVDTWKAAVASQAIQAGADTINDVTALRGDPEIAGILAKSQVPVIIMYSKDPNARTTTTSVNYNDVLQTIKNFFKERLEWGQEQGIRPENIILDPGMGFFVSGIAQYSFQIINRIKDLKEWGYPILLGTSRKSFLANVTPGKQLSPQERGIPSLVSSAIALWEGASLVRLHDIKEGRLMLDTLWAIKISACLNATEAP